jgi:hypothetical protein
MICCNIAGWRHSLSGLSLASHRGGPGLRPGLASATCGGQSGVRARFLRVLQFPLPKPFIPPISPSSSQSPGADTQRSCDELITRPRSPAGCPTYSNRNETESFMEAAKAQNWAVEPQEKKLLDWRFSQR